MSVELVGFAIGAVIMLGAGIFVFIQLSKEIFSGKIALSDTQTPVLWEVDKIAFIRLVIVKLSVILFYCLLFLVCYAQISQIYFT